MNESGRQAPNVPISSPIPVDVGKEGGRERS